MKDTFRVVCPLNCPDQCGMLVKVRDDEVESIRGDPAHPFTKGIICTKLTHYKSVMDSSERIRQPLKRTGKKGAGQFEPISWDQAADEICGRLRQAISQHGSEAILPYTYTGTMGIVNRFAIERFFHALNASQLKRTICVDAAYAGWKVTFGKVIGTDCSVMADSDLIVLWGVNAVSTNMHIMSFIKKARSNGARLIAIDPYRNRTAALADEHIKILPGSDAALALGVMRVLIDEGLIDSEYIEHWTVGFESLKERLLEYPLERVSAETGIDAATVVKFARSYGKARAPFIRIGLGLSRHLNGGMMVRTIGCLPGLVGAFRKPGGGCFLASGDAWEFNMDAVRRPDLMTRQTREINMTQLGNALNDLEHPPISFLYVCASNPVVIAPDSSKIIRGLRREDLYTVVHDQFVTDTAMYADIVLPAPTFLEYTDWYRSYGHYFMQRSPQVLPRRGDTKTSWEAIGFLARKLGLEEPCLYESPEDIIRQCLDVQSEVLKGITAESLESDLPHRANIATGQNPFESGFPTPSGKLEFYSQAQAHAGRDPLPRHVPLSELRRQERQDRYPLSLITPPTHYFLNSSCGGGAYHRTRQGIAKVKIHPADAGERGIGDGNLVRVFNDYGECTLTAEVTDDVMPHVVVAELGGWPKSSTGGGGVNELTSQQLTDLGGSASFHSNVVQVERLEESNRFRQ